MGSFLVLSCLQASYIVYSKGVKSLIFGAWYVLNTSMVVTIVNSRWGSTGRWSGNDCYFSHWKRWTSKAAWVTSCCWQEESLCTAWFRTSHLVGKTREYKGSRRGSRRICASLHGPEGSYWSYLWSAGQCSSLLCTACNNAPVWGIMFPKSQILNFVLGSSSPDLVWGKLPMLPWKNDHAWVWNDNFVHVLTHNQDLRCALYSWLLCPGMCSLFF